MDPGRGYCDIHQRITAWKFLCDKWERVRFISPQQMMKGMDDFEEMDDYAPDDFGMES